jgi:hypothetical protein
MAFSLARNPLCRFYNARHKARRFAIAPRQKIFVDSGAPLVSNAALRHRRKQAVRPCRLRCAPQTNTPARRAATRFTPLWTPQRPPRCLRQWWSKRVSCQSHRRPLVLMAWRRDLGVSELGASSREAHSVRNPIHNCEPPRVTKEPWSPVPCVVGVGHQRGQEGCSSHAGRAKGLQDAGATHACGRRSWQT